MEAASAVSGRHARRFERECERLRPLGEAYLLRHFGHQLGRADAEDAVAEVLIRLHQRAAEGRVPDNLRAMFFTSARNAAIDLLRARAARPATVGLEAAAGAPDESADLPERAESRETVVRFQEALARMREGYRETIMLRFGLGLTVPEIATHFQISEAAAKKRVLRAGRQVRKRMAAIEGEEFCPQMRELARGFAFESEATGLASEAESEALRAHFGHCGSCRSYLTSLRAELHDLGSGALAALLGGERLAGHVDLLHRFGHWAGGAADTAQAGLERLRHLALRGAAPLSAGDGPAGAAMGTGQKIVAVCGAGAAATATCVLGGAVGPGIGATSHPVRPPAKVRRLSSEDAPATPAPVQARAEESPVGAPPSAAAGSDANAATKEGAGEPAPSPPHEAAPVPEEHTEAPAPSEFGIESGSSSSSSTAGQGSVSEPAPEESAKAPPATARPAGGGSSTTGSGSAGSGGGGSVGFQG